MFARSRRPDRVSIVGRDAAALMVVAVLASLGVVALGEEPVPRRPAVELPAVDGIVDLGEVALP